MAEANQIQTQDHNFIAIRRGQNPPAAGNLGEYELGYAIKENGLYIGQKEKVLPKKINISNLIDVIPSADNKNSVIQSKDGSFSIDDIGRIFCTSLIVKAGQGYGTAAPSEVIKNPQEGQIYFQEIVE